MDWLDIFLQIIATAIVVGLIVIFPPSIAFLNMIFWYSREANQQFDKHGHSHGTWWLCTNWSLQKNMEWITPSITGFLFLPFLKN